MKIGKTLVSQNLEGSVLDDIYIANIYMGKGVFISSCPNQHFTSNNPFCSKTFSVIHYFEISIDNNSKTV